MEQVEAGQATTERERSRLRIVEVAAALLARGGRDAVSTRAVAAGAGTQAPAIYRLFGDKEGLLDAVAEHGFASYLARKPAARAGSDPVADLREGWDLHVAFGLANPALFSLMYGDPDPGHRSPAAAAAFDVLRAKIRRIAAAGRLRVDERLAADMVHAAGCGIVLTLLALPPEQRSATLPAATFDALVAAIATPVTDPTAGDAAGPVPAANALRAQLPRLAVLSSGERHAMQEWLDRIVHGTGR